MNRRTQKRHEVDAETAAAIDRLTEQVNLLWKVVDEIREDFQWAVQNPERSGGLPPVMRVTSMALDPCDPKWGEKLNALRPEDLPADEQRPSSAIIVDGEQFEHALDRVAPPGPDGTRPDRVLVKAGEFAEAMESIDQLVYCCTQPQLAWEGDPDAPSIICRACGFVVAEYGNLVDGREEWREEPRTFVAPPDSPKPEQGTLWRDDDVRGE